MTMAADIRAAIVDKIAGIADIGVVQPFERYAHAMDKLKSLYVAAGTQQLLGWFVRREAVSEISAGNNRGRIEKSTWRIQGVMALDDATQSELAFDAKLEQIRDAFRADHTLGGLLLPQVPEGEPADVQLVDAGAVMFAGVLCHGARLALPTYRLITTN